MEPILSLKNGRVKHCIGRLRNSLAQGRYLAYCEPNRILNTRDREMLELVLTSLDVTCSQVQYPSMEDGDDGIP
jgi:hypothetical protein